MHRLLTLGAGLWVFLALCTPASAQLAPVPCELIPGCPANQAGESFVPPPPPMTPADPRRSGVIFVQCPGDTNGDAIPDVPNADTMPPFDGVPDAISPYVKCMHLAAGDGFVTMADQRALGPAGKPLYIFSFSDVTGVLPKDVMNAGAVAANGSAPTIRLKQGEHFFLNLSNAGMVMRPDLADAHTVHYHGFPQAAPVFDGTPDTSISTNQGSTLTYYYKNMEPGTYMYHCHFEVTEHLQMGMVGSLYVEPYQNNAPVGTQLGTWIHQAGQKYAYNDGDGSTRYDVEYPMQIGAFDPEFHNASEFIQPLGFAMMKDRYPMLNGRGYPDTINPAKLVTPTDRNCSASTVEGPGCSPSQPIHSLITATAGQRVLLRISSLVTTRFYTLASTIPMRAVGHNARLLRGPSGNDLSYKTTSVTVGGGESVDVILDTTGVAPGTYLLYTTNLNHLSNDAEDFGGMMTEIRIIAAP